MPGTRLVLILAWTELHLFTPVPAGILFPYVWYATLTDTRMDRTAFVHPVPMRNLFWYVWYATRTDTCMDRHTVTRLELKRILFLYTRYVTGTDLMYSIGMTGTVLGRILILNAGYATAPSNCHAPPGTRENTISLC